MNIALRIQQNHIVQLINEGKFGELLPDDFRVLADTDLDLLNGCPNFPRAIEALFGPGTTLGTPSPALFGRYLRHPQSSVIIVRQLIAAGARLFKSTEHYVAASRPDVFELMIVVDYPFGEITAENQLRECLRYDLYGGARALFGRYKYPPTQLKRFIYARTLRRRWMLELFVQHGVPVPPPDSPSHGLRHYRWAPWFYQHHGHEPVLRARLVASLGVVLPGDLARYILRAT